MSDIVAQRNGAPTNVHFVKHIDEEFGRLIVRSKDVERVMHGVVDTARERVHVVRLFNFSEPIVLEHSRRLFSYSGMQVCELASTLKM